MSGIDYLFTLIRLSLSMVLVFNFPGKEVVIDVTTCFIIPHNTLQKFFNPPIDVIEIVTLSICIVFLNEIRFL